MRCEIGPSVSKVLWPSSANQKEAENQNEQADHANPLGGTSVMCLRIKV